MEQVDRQFAFHRLGRSVPGHRWWKPLLTALLGAAFYVVLTVILLLIGVIAALATSADVEQYMTAAAAIDLSDPVIFAFTLISLILMIPALWLAVLLIGPKPVGLLSSVAGRIRWRWLTVCTAAALAIYLVSLLVSTVIGSFFPAEGSPAPLQQDTSTLVVLLALTLLAVPFQAAAEEYVFRGFLMQAIGSWLRHPAFAILLPVPLFVLGHGYDPLGQTDVAIFAIFAGWITWRTGGLEAAIAVHAINNMTVFALGAVGLVDVNSTEGSVGGLVVSVVTMAVTATVIVRLADRRGIDRTRTVSRRQSVEAPAPGHPLPAGPWPARAYDPHQYDPSRYAPANPTIGAPAAAPRGAAEPTSGGRTQPALGRPAPYPPTLPAPPRAPALGDSYQAAPAGPALTGGSAPAPTISLQGGSRNDQRAAFPSGPAHPPGPGYPSGTSHPTGPAHPPAAASTSGQHDPLPPDRAPERSAAGHPDEHRHDGAAEGQA
jgi:membrane protease YdiL (CAAX protease family)